MREMNYSATREPLKKELFVTGALSLLLRDDPAKMPIAGRRGVGGLSLISRPSNRGSRRHRVSTDEHREGPTVDELRWRPALGQLGLGVGTVCWDVFHRKPRRMLRRKSRRNQTNGPRAANPDTATPVRMWIFWLEIYARVRSDPVELEY